IAISNLASTGLPISVPPITNDSEIVEENQVKEQELVEELQHQIDALYTLQKP
ncbi:11374_t:CDS:2, partial [Racocetra fulgida]